MHGKRQIVLDTETTGLEPTQGHRIIEIGCVELQNRRITGENYHQYLDPEREIEDGAYDVHGLSSQFLAGKPLFADVVEAFIDFIRDGELIIHNAPFDVGFIDVELGRVGHQWGQISDYCKITDTLVMAKAIYPGQRNNLDALCKRHGIDNSRRDVHGALLDAQILADVYLTMTGGQAEFLLDDEHAEFAGDRVITDRKYDQQRSALRIIQPSDEELEAHYNKLDEVEQASGGNCLWKKTEGSP